MTTQPPPNMPLLRALPLTSVLDTAFRLYRTNLRAMLRPLLLCVIIVLCIQLSFNSNNNLPIDWNTISPLRTRTLFNQLQMLVLLGPTLLNEQQGRIILDGLISLILCTGLLGSLIAFVADRYLHTHGTNVYTTEAKLLQHWFAFKVIGLGVASMFVFLLQLTSMVWAMGANDLMSLLVFGRGDGMSAPFALAYAARYEAPWVLGAFGCLAIIARFLLAPQIIVLENAGLPRALWRSWQLTQRAWGRTMLAALLVSLILGLITAIPTTLSDFLFVIIPESSAWLLALASAMNVAADLGELFMVPWILTVFTILYYDQRIRHEGFDLDVAQRQQVFADVEPLWQRGRERWAQHDLAGAMQEFDTALRIDPDNLAALHLRSSLKLQNRDFSGALVDAEHWVAVSPGNATALGQRGCIYVCIGNRTQAASDFDAALRIAPHNVALLQYRATLRFEHGDLPGAMKDLQHLLRYAPASDWAHYNLACVAARWKRLDLALRHLEQAVMRNQHWLAQAHEDTDFDALRTDPRFIALLDTAPTSAT